MATLPDQLRELYARYGDRLLDDADGLRAVLDDYLEDGVATPGEVNMVVEAVRFGVVPRLRALVDAQAEPMAAVDEVGDVLARERGGGIASARWSVAVVGYAIGRIPEQLIATYDPEAGHRSGHPPPAPAQQPPPQAAPAPPAGADETTEPQSASGRPLAPTQRESTSPTQVVSSPDWLRPEPEPSRPTGRGRALLWAAVAAVLVIVGASVLVWALLDDPADGPAANPLPQSAPLEDDEMIWSVKDGEDWDLVAGRLGETPRTIVGKSRFNETNPVISPDRRSVVYVVHDRTNGMRTFWVVAADGTRARPLWPEADQQCNAGEAAWSPVGDEVAVVCVDRAGLPQPGIKILRLSDGALDRTLVAEQYLGGVSLAWSSDGYIAYGQSNENTSLEKRGGDLYRVPASGEGDPTRLTSSPGVDAQPSWSPDGLKIVFQRYDDSGSLRDIYLIDLAANTLPARIDASTDKEDYDPAWSPDGTQVAFSSGGEVLLVDLDDLDSARPAFADDAGGGYRLAWTRQ